MGNENQACTSGHHKRDINSPWAFLMAVRGREDTKAWTSFLILRLSGRSPPPGLGLPGLASPRP